MPRQTKLSLVPDPPLPPKIHEFYKAKAEPTMKAILHKITAADWAVWAYLQLLDPFGDRLCDLPDPATIGKTLALSPRQVKRSMNRLEELDLWNFEYIRVRGQNLWGNHDKVVSSRQNCPTPDKVATSGQSCLPSAKLSDARQTCPMPSPKPLPKASSSFPQTIQTYSDFIQTLSDNERERFLQFCDAKTIDFSPPLAKLQTWLGSIDSVTGLPHYVELYEKFQRSPQEVQIRNQQHQQAQTERWESDARLSDWLWEWSSFHQYGLTSEWINLATTETEKLDRIEFASWAELHGVGRPETQREDMPPSLIDAMTLSPREQQKIQAFADRKQQLKSRLQSSVISRQ